MGGRGHTTVLDRGLGPAALHGLGVIDMGSLTERAPSEMARENHKEWGRCNVATGIIPYRCFVYTN